MKRVENIIIDVKSKSYDEILLKQMDTTRLIFKVLDNNQEILLSGLTVDVVFTKPDNTIVIQNAAINEEENNIIIDLKEDCLRNYGKAKIEIELKKGEEVLSSFQKIIQIEKTSKENIKSDNTPNYIEYLDKALNDFNKEADEMLNTLEQEASSIVNEFKTTNTTSVSEEITVTDCAEVNAKLDIKNGKTIQDGTPTPEAPIEIRNVGDNINLIYPFTSENYTIETGNTNISERITDNKDGTYTFVGGGGSTYRIKCKQKIKAKENDSFTFNFKKISGGDIRLIIRAYKSDTTIISTSVSGFVYNSAYQGYYTDNPFNKQFICPAETAYISYDLMARTETPTIVFDIKFERGLKATPFTPYNCGSVDFKVENIKNYLDWNKFIVASNWIEGSSSGYKAFKIDGLKPNTLYTLCRTDNEGYGKGTFAGFNTSKNNTNMFIHNTSQENNKQSISATSSPEGILYITYYESMVLSSFINIIKECWIIEGNSFIQRKEQIVSFPLAEGQVLHNGDYLASDGIHQKRKTVKLSELSWGLYTSISYENYIAFVSWPGAKNETNNINTLSNILPLIKNGWEKQSENMSRFTSGVYIRILKSRLETQDVAGFKSWLSNIEGMLEYELAEEIVIPYTTEQEEAYYQLQHLLMYEGYTNISCIDEIKPDIKLTYYYNNLLNKSYAKRFDELEEKIRNLQIGG